jgi:hypothetical protein
MCVRGGVEDVRVPGIERDVGNAGVVVDCEHVRPGLASVGRPIEAALPSRRPEGPFRRDVHHVPVPRVDEDLADVLGSLEPHLPPGPAAVEALVDAVPPAHVATAHVLASADPYDVGVGRIQGDATHRVGRLVVEDRLPGDAGVLRLPHSPRADRDVPHAAVARADGDVGSPTAHQGGADAAQREAPERLFRHAVVAGRGRGRRRCRGKEQESRQAGRRKGTQDFPLLFRAKIPPCTVMGRLPAPPPG